MNSVIVKLGALINQRHAIYEPKLITRRILFRPFARFFNIEFVCCILRLCVRTDRSMQCKIYNACALCDSPNSFHDGSHRIAGACDFAVCNVTARRGKRVQYHKSRNVPSVEIAKLKLITCEPVRIACARYAREKGVNKWPRIREEGRF